MVQDNEEGRFTVIPVTREFKIDDTGLSVRMTECEFYHLSGDLQEGKFKTER